MHRFLVLCALVCFSAAVAAAQTPVSGVCEFDQPDPQHVIPIGDRPNHSFGVDQLKCTWTKPHEIGNGKSKEGVSTETTEISGNTIRAHGIHVTTMESGDKYFVSYTGTGTSKGGVLQSTKGTWSYTGGTGKLKGIKGKGTYTCAASGDKTKCDIAGEYQLPK
jgi:hypothetical protein